MMIFEEPSKNSGGIYNKIKPGLKIGSIILSIGLVLSFGLVLKHRAAMVRQDDVSQNTNPTIYVPPDVVFEGTGKLQGHFTVDSVPTSTTVVIYKSDGSVASQLTTDNAGYFEASLPSGYYTLQVNESGQVNNRRITIFKDSTVVEDISL